MKKFVIAVYSLYMALALLSPLQTYVVRADDCTGSAEVCAEIRSLRSKVGELRESNDKMAELSGVKENTSDRMAKSIAIAGTMAILLKMLTSVLRGWKGRVHADADKAKIKIASISVGVLAFLATNIGAGLPWWQAIVIAGGGPGSIAVHEIMKLVPVLQGKKKMPLSNPPPAS